MVSLFVAETIVFSSTAGAAEWWGHLLGEYVEAGEHGGRPYYRQRDTEGNTETFLYSEEDGWFVSHTIGHNYDYGLRNYQKTAKPPSNQWLYSIGEGKDVDDDTFTLEFGRLFPPKSHTIKGEGPMVNKVGSALGKYRSLYSCATYHAASNASYKDVQKYMRKVRSDCTVQQAGGGNVEQGPASVQES